MKQLIFFLVLICLPPQLWAATELSGAFTQGGLIQGQTEPGNRVYYGEREIKVSDKGQFLLGFHRDAKLSHSLTLISPSGDVSVKDFIISERSYRVQRINGISKKMMAPNEKDLQQIKQDAEQAKRARQIDSNLQHFSENFLWPLNGPITGVYGSQRVLNGELRRPHFGIDIAAPTGTPIISPAGGRVSLAQPGMFFAGTTLIIDHGHGLSSSYLHLDKILVKTGETIQQGQKIATVGSTGRVTGPHLDWRINWFEQRLDPALLVPKK